jgi:hypothetical protein
MFLDRDSVVVFGISDVESYYSVTSALDYEHDWFCFLCCYVLQRSFGNPDPRVVRTILDQL